MKKEYKFKGSLYLFEDYDDDINSPYGVDYGIYISNLDDNSIAIIPGEHVKKYCYKDKLDPEKADELILENFGYSF